MTTLLATIPRSSPGLSPWSAPALQAWARSELYDARNLVFAAGPQPARMRLTMLLQLATARSSAAFECPVGVTSACYALAEVLAAEGLAPSRVLALLHIGLAVFPAEAHRRCSQWPLQGRELSLAFLRAAVSHASIAQQPLLRAAPRLRVAVITACAGVHTEAERALCAENRRHYTELHGYSLHFFRDAAAVVAASKHRGDGAINLTAANAPAFWRAHAVQSVIDAHEEFDWILWLDCDVLLTDLKRRVESLLPARPDDDAVGGASLVVAAHASGVSAEVWLLRPSVWARSFLQRWTRRLPASGSSVLSERKALQHAVLPDWAATLLGEAQQPMDWASIRWPADVHIAEPGLLLSPQRLEPDDLPLEHLQHAWRPGDFAWHDPSCGRLALASASTEEVCRRRRLEDEARRWQHVTPHKL
eukprot:gnl/TRDRNA2_/TRDRNA2_92435_c0_seq2.p1 gnl/TRDRNA2_/TRDRNA2_92435_c0~~gnl/TRDRNA2_/TRDRNA2_92435_c0_seq2.p1  ORF type:complete len:419 (+),score=50.39 gnl/TRDRNA2_/TRDRNA2_92435_c0_seq2:148-1404(+)